MIMRTCVPTIDEIVTPHRRTRSIHPPAEKDRATTRPAPVVSAGRSVTSWALTWNSGRTARKTSSARAAQ